MVDKPGRRKRHNVRWPILFTVVVIIFLTVSLVYYLQPPGVLPPQNRVREYVDEVIACYTDLVTIHYSLNPNFSTLKPYFRLYNSSAGSFEVLVMPAEPSNISNTVALIFEPINSSKTTILFDYGDTFQQLYFGDVIYANSFTLTNGTLDVTGSPTHFNLAFNTPRSDFTSYTFLNANIDALHLFETDASETPSYTPTTFTLGACPSPPPWYHSIVDFLRLLWRTVGYWLFYVGGGILTLVMFYWEVLPRIQRSRTSNSETKG